MCLFSVTLIIPSLTGLRSLPHHQHVPIGPTEDFFKTVEDCFYTQHVQFPTTDDSVLRYSDPDFVSDVQVLHNLGNVITTWLLALFTTNMKFLLTSGLFMARPTAKGIILLCGGC